MNNIDKRILGFIEEHHVLTLAVTRDNVPWCASCFYVYLPDRNWFAFTSDEDTRHIRDVIDSGNFQVAGTIALETKMIGKIRGIQFSGQMIKPMEEDLKMVKRKYLKRFPVARFAELKLWIVRPDHFKMTDNRLGFGKKLIWNEKED